VSASVTLPTFKGGLFQPRSGWLHHEEDVNQQPVSGSAVARAASPAATTGEDLGVYVAHLQELVLYLRDEGHFLSSIDQHIIEGWWEAGYPLEVVLRIVHERGLRLKARKNPPRGLPLRSLARHVEKAGVAALQQAVGSHRPSGSADTTAAAHERIARLRLVLAGLESDVSDASALRDPRDPSQPHLAALLDDVSTLSSSASSEVAVFNALLAMGRRYYDALWNSWPAASKAEIRGQVLHSLGAGAALMSGEALEETVTELCRRQLRNRDPLFDPDRYWRIS
jgi:hypothetical protein